MYPNRFYSSALIVALSITVSVLPAHAEVIKATASMNIVPESHSYMDQPLSDASKGEIFPPGENMSISYMTGGIGIEERTELEAVKKQYNLHVLSAARSGDYIGDARIIIFKGKDEALLNLDAGPIFYAKLPPGNYTVQMTFNGQAKKQTVTIAADKPTALRFIW